MDALDDLMKTRSPTARRPLLGLTVLIVEDSKFASEAVRQLCLRSGARIRRADSLENARRHLAVYRPTVLMVDVGLPDGSGVELIETLSAVHPRIEVILGISGDPNVQDAVLAAGADGFIEKPMANLAAFQAAILSFLPSDRQPPGPRKVADEVVAPDPIALRDDLNHIAEVLKDQGDTDIGYVTQFLGGLARCVDDQDLDQAVQDLASLHTKGGDLNQGVANLSELVNARIAASAPI